MLSFHLQSTKCVQTDCTGRQWGSRKKAVCLTLCRQGKNAVFCTLCADMERNKSVHLTLCADREKKKSCVSHTLCRQGEKKALCLTLRAEGVGVEVSCVPHTFCREGVLKKLPASQSHSVQTGEKLCASHCRQGGKKLCASHSVQTWRKKAVRLIFHADREEISCLV